MRKRTSGLKRENDIIIGAEEEGKRRRGEAEEGEWEESTPKTPSRQTSLEGLKEDCSSHIRALRDGQWRSAFKIAVSSPCLTKTKNERPVWKYDSHGI